ncbi:cytochrome P450 [Phyllosticta paracitricarpa]|uniref:Benzoate 4-monooxygenase cytochrome P450 n=1 Tax=Phyllosticta paracitricarpa TaxID=2016321 RepID=A0ABR1ND02_9PEZI
MTILYLILFYLSYLAVKRLVFSPIARFPGPKLAALTRWYEFVYDVIFIGRFNWKVDELHEKYGPIVRINPEELHINDPDFWDEFYARGAKSTRWNGTNGRFSGRGAPQAIPSTLDNDLHRIRRAAMLPLFSKRSINDIEPLIHEKMELACGHLTRHAQTGEPINMVDVWSALAADIITQYGWGLCLDSLKSEDCKMNLHYAILAAGRASQFFIHFIYLQNRVAEHVPSLVKSNPDAKHPIIFSALYHTPRLSPGDKSIPRLGAEVGNLVGAGSETTGWSLSVATYHIAASPRITAKLRRELAGLNLAACVKEGLRFSLGVASRSPRVYEHDITYREWVIPAGTPVSMTGNDVGMDPRVFEKPELYCPERWMEEEDDDDDDSGEAGDGEKGEPREGMVKQRGRALHNGEPLDRYFVVFGKGDRNCLGLTLAMAELHLGLGTLFRKYELELFETDESDVKMAHDFFIAAPKLDSKGVRVRVRELEK